MPHQPCTACLHPEKNTIDTALRKGTPSLRELAGRFGISKSALDRHRKHIDPAKARVGVGQIERIDAEIKKLIRAQTRAKRRRDNAGDLRIARELRNWFTLRVKAEAAAASEPEKAAEMTRAEAVATAKTIIEAEMSAGGEEIFAWLVALLERVSTTKITTGSTASTAKSVKTQDETLLEHPVNYPIATSEDE